MLKRISPFLLVLIIAGCARPTDRAQQYLDSEFTTPLTSVSDIHSNAPRNFSAFTRQAEMVTENSPSMAEKYQPLYTALSEWIMQSGELSELPGYGIQFAQLGGGDDRGNVLFTGYFSPVMELRHQPDDRFKYPVYSVPETCAEQCPTRAEIYGGALDGQELELGYAENMIDPFIMEVQGSGFVHYGDDDTLEYFAYAGKNNHPYVSIGRVLIDRDEVPREKMSLKAIKEWVLANDEATVREVLEQNTSYVFFKPMAAAPVKGTAGIPLMAMASVAGDRSLFPMGTPILAEVPLLNADGSWSGTHVLKLLLVLDTGGAVTESHLDLYHGVGPRAGTEAGHYKHFGRVWKLGLANSATQDPWLTEQDKASLLPEPELEAGIAVESRD